MTIFSDSMLCATGVPKTYTFVAQTAANSLTATKPTGTIEGDFILGIFACQQSSGTASGAIPSGWTLIVSRSNSDGKNVKVGYKIAGPSEPSSYTWTNNTTFDWHQLLTYRGPTAVDVFTTPIAAPISSTSQDALSITTLNPGMLVASYIPYNATPAVTSGPSGMTIRGPSSGVVPPRTFDLLVSPAGATGDKNAVFVGAQATINFLLQLY